MSIRASAFWCTVSIVLLLIALAFTVSGCQAFYRAIGMSTQEAIDTAKDDEAKADSAIGGLDGLLDAGKDAVQTKIVTVVKEVRSMFWECLYAGIGIAGAGVSGWLALRTRNLGKVNKAMIKGVEKANGKDIKKSITKEATALFVGDKLHKLVKRFT